MNTKLSAADQSECLLRIFEAAPQVCRRYQFFLWTQADLQRWIPHKLLVCGAYDRGSRSMVFDVFNSIPMPEPAMQGLRDERHVILSHAIQLWQRRGLQACIVNLDDLPTADRSVAALRAAGYSQLLVHGTSRPSRPSEVESFFLLGSPGQSHSDECLRAMGLLMPYMHVTYQRAYATERQMGAGTQSTAATSAQSPSKVAPITHREREILLWVRDGLNNHQISEKLSISALTVKNHIQRILRKLGAANRAQAVAIAMSMNMFGGFDDVSSHQRSSWLTPTS